MTTQIKAKGFKEGFRPSRTLSITATKAELKAFFRYILHGTVHPINILKELIKKWLILKKLHC